MGMAASQARLLTITARMHDVEYQAQSIQNAKIALATQSDEVYQEYLAALDEQTLTIKDWQGNVITANFNNLCGINAVDSTYQYALMDDKGRLIVDGKIAEKYREFMNATQNQGDAYAFAYFMLGNTYGETNFTENNVNDAYNSVIYGYQHGSDGTETDSDLRELWRTIEDKAKDKKLKYTYNEDTKQYVFQYSDDTDGASGLYKTGEDKDFDALLCKYYYLLNKRHGQEIFTNICKMVPNEEAYAEFYDEKTFDKEFNYYVNIFKQIQANGGSCVSLSNCVSVSSYDGFDGDAANNSEWLRDMIQSGKITVEHVNMDKTNGRLSFDSTSVPSDSVLEYTTTSTIDSTALAKAQAEYEHKTKEIDRKDKKFDLDLSKLDTQRNALKTEYESVKKVISENIDRTFGIFS